MPGGSAFGRLGSPKSFLPAYTSETQGRPPGWERRASSRDALLRYTIPMPDDSRIPGQNVEEMALNGSVLSSVKFGGLVGALTHERPCRSLPHSSDGCRGA